jgi:hypothetical protein
MSAVSYEIFYCLTKICMILYVKELSSLYFTFCRPQLVNRDGGIHFFTDATHEVKPHQKVQSLSQKELEDRLWNYLPLTTLT